jgi:uncharacterized protein YjiK
MNDPKRKFSFFKTAVGKIFNGDIRNFLFRLSVLAVVLALILPFLWVPASSAQGNAAFIRQVRVMESDEAGVLNPVGLAFSSRANAFQVIEGQSGSVNTDLVKLTPFADRAGSTRIAAAIKDPINVAFDNRVGRLLILHSSANQLLEVQEDANGNLDLRTLTRHNIQSFDLQDPQGMAFDEARGVLYILDAAGPRIVRVEPGADGSFERAGVSTIDLVSSGLTAPRGLAFEPGTGNLHVMVPTAQKLYEVTLSGEVVAERDLAEFGLKDPQGMVFAPSGDQTDDPSQVSLFLADSGQNDGQVAADLQSTGQILELSLTQPMAAAPATFTSTIVKTTDMSTIKPPSPDPSGITYLPNNNRLMVVDGEVEETVNNITHFQGANVWELTLGGAVIRTANISKKAPTVVPMTDEPTGVTWNPNDGHYFITEDGGKRVYNLNPGGDGLVGTSDDSWTFFSTNTAGNGDPEGIALDTRRNRLFVADGVNREVYEYTLTGSPVGHFDVGVYGVEDPESVEFNSDSGTLFVMSSNRPTPLIVETTISGALLQTIDISAPNAKQAAGLAYAPASNGSGVKRFYIVDRAIDNNNDPRIIDGKMYEMTAPSSGSTNTAPVVNAGVDQTIALPNSASLDGTVSDDGLPNPPGTVTTTWSKVSGPGTVTFGNASAVDTTASFSVDGVYTLRLTANDSALSTSDNVVITVNPSGTNTAPVVSAGMDQTVTLPSNANLDGTASDDGLPTPPALTTTWSQVTGPGTVSFGNASAVDTTASFSVDGVYTLRLTADDSAFSTSDDVIITVNAVVSDLIFKDGFESGNFSAWTANTNDLGDLSVSAAAALIGSSRGMQAVIDDNNTIYVTDDTPNAEPRYRARFYFDPNSIAMLSGDTHFIFRGYSGTSTIVLRVQFRFSNGSYQLRAGLVGDGSTWTNSSWLTISDAPHAIELDWSAATAVGANNGSLGLWIDGVQRANLIGVDNDTRRIDQGRLGAVSGIDTGTRGTYYFDAFESRRQTFIGP